jgi:hypothetical protein
LSSPTKSSSLKSTFAAAPSRGVQTPRASSSALAPDASPVLSLDGQSPAAIGLHWTDTTTETFVNYTVQEASQASGWNFSIVTVVTTAATLSYVASGVTPGLDYDWEIVEYQESCFIVCKSPTSLTSNILNLTQPAVAFLHHTALSPTGITLEWTNNATYGGLISFDEYTVWQSTEGGAYAAVAVITNVSTNVSALTLTSGDSYSFYVQTEDCTSDCGVPAAVLSTTQSNLLTVGTPLTLEVIVLAHSSTIDLGQSDYFTCTPTGGQSPFSYSWNFATGSSVPGNASEGAVLGNVSVNTVTCEVTDSELPAAHASNSADVTVNPTLTVTGSENLSAADVGQSIDFDCSASNGTSPYVLGWNFGDGVSTSFPDSAQANSPHTYGTAGDYAPTCTVSDAAGALTTWAQPLVISPTLVVASTGSSDVAAPGTPLAFTAYAANGSGTYVSYAWTFSVGSTGSGRETNHTFTVPGVYIVGLVVTDSNGARASSFYSVDVTDIGVTVSPRVTSATTGSAVSFTASATGGAGAPYNYTWSFGDGTMGYGASVQHAYSNTGTDTPTLVVTDRLGATNTTTLPAISVTAPPPAFSWLTGWVVLGIALVIGAVIAIIVLSRRRRAESAEMETASSAYVPPTDPKKTIRGSKVCDFCGASNLPIRTTCSNCGKPLPRGPGS